MVKLLAAKSSQLKFSFMFTRLRKKLFTMVRFSRSLLLLMTLHAIVLVGCSKPTAKLVPAKGTITIGGKPAGNISLQFLPDVKENAEGLWPSSTAISAADGSFELMTTDNQPGATPGAHKIVLADLDEERPEQGKERTMPIRLDPGYAIAGKLTLTVEEGKPIEIKIP